MIKTMTNEKTETEINQSKNNSIKIILVITASLIGLSFILFPAYDYRALRIFEIFTKIFEVARVGIIALVIILIIYFIHIKTKQTKEVSK